MYTIGLMKPGPIGNYEEARCDSNTSTAKQLMKTFTTRFSLGHNSCLEKSGQHTDLDLNAKHRSTTINISCNTSLSTALAM